MLTCSSNLVFVYLQCYINYSGTFFVCLTIIVHYVRPSSADFPKLAVRSKVGPPKEIRESEKVVDEKVTRRTEEYVDEVTGERRVRTVEYVEKLIERQVL